MQSWQDSEDSSRVSFFTNLFSGFLIFPEKFPGMPARTLSMVAFRYKDGLQ